MRTIRCAGVALALLSGAIGPAVYGQSREGGRVPIESLRPHDLETMGAKSGPQNFAVAEDRRGVMYLANNLGVIVLDGRTARLIELPGKASALSLDVDERGRIWVGAVGNLGYLDADAGGRLGFVSLLEKVPKGERDFGDVWQTSPTSAGVYFRSPSHLFRWDGKAMRVWKAPDGFHIGNAVGDRLFVRQVGIGLSTVEGDELRLLPGGERFAEERVYVILPYGDGRLLLIGRESGATLFDPTGQTSPENLVTEADDFFAAQQVYHGCVLPDGTFAITSVRGGVAVIDRDGRLVARLDKHRGLGDDMVFFAFVSSARRLWLGLNYGVSIADCPAAITRHPNEGETGLEGFVESIARYRGALYASTGRGVYRMAPAARPGEDPRFTAVRGTDTQCYTLLEAAGTLLAATRDGVVAIEGDVARKIDPDFAYSLAPMLDDSDRVLVAFDRGVGLLAKVGGTWRVVARNEEAGHVGVGILDAGDGEVWAGTESDGLYRLHLDEMNGKARLTLLDRYDQSSGLPEGWIYPYRIGGRLGFGTLSGIYRFREGEGRFEADPLFSPVFTGRSAFRMEPDGDTLWIVSENEVVRLVRNGAGWREVPTGIRRIGGGDRILSFLVEGDVLWVGGDRGLVRFVKSKEVVPPPPRALVREARLGDGRVLFAGAFAANGGIVAPQTRELPPIPHEKNTIRFAFAAGARRDLDFAYRLDGFDRGWSAWTREPWKEYTNLPGGSYTFRVRARDRYSQIGPQAALAFSVLPPWYLTWWALASFVLVAGLLAMALVRAREARLRRRNIELQRLVDEKTVELREASYTDPLTSLRNRRYFSQVTAYETAHPPREGPPKMLLLLIDLDLFKSVNDRFGHGAGDAVLIETAKRLGAVTRESDLLFRWGGEEFLLVARGLPAENGAELAGRILGAIGSQPYRVRGEDVRLTASVGWAPFPLDSSGQRGDIEAVLDLADRALYQAKAEGRNRSVAYDAVSSHPA